jgi:hypothetical protein
MAPSARRIASPSVVAGIAEQFPLPFATANLDEPTMAAEQWEVLDHVKDADAMWTDRGRA